MAGDSMHIPLPPPSFPQGPRPNEESALETPTSIDLDSPPPLPSSNQRVSFSGQRHRLSVSRRYRSLVDPGMNSPSSERPPIPSALPTASMDSNPLPKIPMIVLCVAVLGEFLSANVSTPFIVDMVKAFGLPDEAELGAYTGIIISSFFVTQFLTSLLWATVATKHGNRAVLFVALTGNAITCALFGTCTSFPQAVAVRLIQGVFNGAVGVARSSVMAVTDPTNESRAYGIMGFSWGLGGVAGAIIGGAFQKPSEHWPNSFGKIPLFRTYPYLLPPLIVASILMTGAILSLFLAWDGGPRSSIYLIEKNTDEEQGTSGGINLDSSQPAEEPQAPSGPLSQLKTKVNRKISGYFATRVRDAHQGDVATSPATGSPMVGSPLKARAFSRSSKANPPGSAYGYRSRLGSRATFSSGLDFRRGSMASTVRNRPAPSTSGHRQEDTEATNGTEDLNFAQRLVIANEFTATSLTNLWVAAAISADNEDPFEASDDDEMSNLSSDDELDLGPKSFGSPSSPPPNRSRRLTGNSSRRGSFAAGSGIRAHRPSVGFAPLSFSRVEPENFSSGRHYSVTSHLLPAIYANPGVSTPPALEAALSSNQSPAAPASGQADPFADGNSLAPIIESGSMPGVAPATTAQDEKLEVFKWSLLPLFIVFQYFVLALHTTSHDQVFLMYLTSPYDEGGLGLDPGHFAELIALMCIAQVVYQFYLYPNLGPPRGKFSHLAMFRLGSALFIPSYLTVTIYRVFASATEDGNNIVMALLALSTAVRYAGATFAYTSIAVLLNYMSPPHLVSFTNGLAQSLASLARVLGPLLGGALWSVSTAGNPSGYPFGFYAVSLVCAMAIFLSFFIR